VQHHFVGFVIEKVDQARVASRSLCREAEYLAQYFVDRQLRADNVADSVQQANLSIRYGHPHCSFHISS
jgi:hypothetical protein